MIYDAEISRFIARAFRAFGMSFEERKRITDQIPREGEQLPENVADWVRAARRSVPTKKSRQVAN
jgi:hypothetical protein